MTLRIIFISVPAVLAIALAACGGEADPPGGQTPQLRVAATTGVVADLVENVAGSGVEVVQVIPDGSSPHDFQLSAADRGALEEADLIVAVGAGLEAGLPLEDVDVPRWELTEHAGELLPFSAAGAHAHEEKGEEAGHEQDHEAEAEDSVHAEDHGSVDPHVWMDPTRAAAALPSLASALADGDPDRARELSDRAEGYATRLRELDRELRSILAAVPAADREIVASHDSLGYLADRYGFEVVATAFPTSGPEAEASAAKLQEVIDEVTEHGVAAVFAQQEDDPKALRLVAEEAGVAIEEGLLIESPGSARSYEEMLRTNAELIAAALAPG